MKPLDRMTPEELAARVPRGASWAGPFLSLPAARQYRLAYRLVLAHLAPGSRVLDWGTGSGHFSYFLRTAGMSPVGLQFAEDDLSDWLDHPYQTFVSVDGSDPVGLPFGDAAFDAVASIGVLEHVRETGGTEPQSLAEIRRVLRPAGHFVCVHLPNRYSWIELIASAIPGKHHHRYRYRRGEIERLLDEAGFELLTLQRYGALPRNVFARLPERLRSSSRVADLVDATDAVLLRILSPIAQNWALVARRRE